MGKTKTKVTPIIASSHIKEDDSRYLFQRLVKPWMIINWFVKDYGIDANIEISKSILLSKDQIATGKRFSLQIKSTTKKITIKSSITLVIEKEKITYWYNSLEPVMLAYADLNSSEVYYLWIDDQLIESLGKENQNWIAQETVTIKFDKLKTISKDSLHNIEKYVFNWKRPSKTILTPGNYFKYSQEAMGLIKGLNELVKLFKIPFLPDELDSLTNEFSKSIYTIAIVGPSRVGKSTLINSLLDKQVSPVDILPTTGIPISIFPFNENKTLVLLKDGSTIEGPVETEFLNEYTSQQRNPENKKKVKFVSVNIVNQKLEKGLSLCDVPGLDDPDEDIRNITKTALYNVNAIVYVMSVASFKEGEFSITKQNIDDLNQLAGRMDRIFLVFNKIDKLSENELQTVKNYINTQLQKFDITRFLPTPPIFISSKLSLDNRISGNKLKDSVFELEELIWKFLLDSNKTGLHKILSGFNNCKAIIDKLRNLIQARLISTQRRVEIEKELNQVKQEIQKIRDFIGDERKRVVEELTNHLDNSLQNIIIDLREQLTSIPTTQQLPSKNLITAHLEKYAFQSISDTNTSFQQSVYVLQSRVNQWISEKLKQVEMSLEDMEHSENTETLNIPNLGKYTGQIFSFFQNNKGGPYIGLLETIFTGAILAIGWALGSLIDIFTSNEKIRKREIEAIISKTKKGYQKIHQDFTSALNNSITSICRRIEEKSLDRAKVYLGELKSQISKLDTPLENETRNSYNLFIKELSSIEQTIASNFVQLKDYTDSIDWDK